LEQISPLCMYDQTQRVLVAMFSLLLHTDNSIMCVLFLLLSSIFIIFVSLLLSPNNILCPPPCPRPQSPWYMLLCFAKTWVKKRVDQLTNREPEFFFFLFFWCSWSDNHPKGSLAKFGYKQDMKVKKVLSILHIFGYMLEPNREIWNFF